MNQLILDFGASLLSDVVIDDGPLSGSGASIRWIIAGIALTACIATAGYFWMSRAKRDGDHNAQEAAGSEQ